jgi:hypothetical protein
MPVDWSEIKNKGIGHSVAYENSDKSKGIFLTSWKLDPQKDIKLHLLKTSQLIKDTANKMEGYNFSILRENIDSKKKKCTSLIDLFDNVKSYRIVCKSIIYCSIMIKCSFHDYWCTNINESNVFCELIIDLFDVNMNRNFSF